MAKIDWGLLKARVKEDTKQHRQAEAAKFGNERSNLNFHGFVYCTWKRDEAEYYIGLRRFLQAVYDNNTPKKINNLYPHDCNNGFRNIIYRGLCNAYNKGDLKIQFVEVD